MRRRRSRTHDEPGSFGRIFSNTATALVAVILALGLAEWGAGLVMGSIGEAPANAMPTYSDADIAKLYDSETPRLYREVLAEGWGMGAAVYSPLVEYRMPAHSGKHFTISAEGYRSIGRPQNMAAPGAKVFVFGGSTTFGAGVPDGETIPAYLDGVLAAAGKEAQVFNLAATSWYSTQERIALERLLTSGIKPDIAVFVDGTADFHWCQVPDRTAWSDRLAKASGLAQRLPLLAELGGRSQLLALGRRMIGDGPAESPDRAAACATDADVEKVIGRLDTNRRIIAAMADKLGFKALFVQQPVPSFHYDNAKRPVAVKAEAMSRNLGSAKGYPRMAEMRASGKLFDQNLLWLAELEPAEGNAYVDTVHYSPRFNRAIAETIGRHILDNSLLP